MWNRLFRAALVLICSTGFLGCERMAFFCSAEESPDKQFTLEMRSIPRLVTMPGDGGCGQGSGYIVLRDSQGHILHKVYSTYLFGMGKTNWSDEQVEFTFENDGIDSAKWHLPPIEQTPAIEKAKAEYRLFEAIHSGDLVEVAIQLALHPSLDVRDRLGMTALHVAVMEAKIDIVRALLEHGAPVLEVDHEGHTALHLAPPNTPSSRAILKLLLDKGADPNARDTDGRTPLHAALSIEEMAILVKYGGDINASDGWGHRPLNYNSSGPAFSWLLRHGAKLEPGSDWSAQLLFDQAAQGTTKELFVLLNSGETANTLIDGETLLAHAIRNDQEKMAIYLVQHGADIHIHDQLQGETPLHLAVSYGMVRLAQLLLERGASISAVDVYGKTAFAALTKGPQSRNHAMKELFRRTVD